MSSPLPGLFEEVTVISDFSSSYLREGSADYSLI